MTRIVCHPGMNRGKSETPSISRCLPSVPRIRIAWKSMRRLERFCGNLRWSSDKTKAQSCHSPPHQIGRKSSCLRNGRWRCPLWQRIRMGSCCRGSTERQGSGTRSGTSRSVLAGSGSDAPDYPHSLYSTTEGAHNAGSRLRTIARRSVIGRPGKIEAIEEWGCHLE